MNNNRHMDLETFAACVLQTLQQKLSYINIQLVHKAAENDATIPLLTFTSKNRHHTIYPSIPIELYYNEYISGTNLRDLLTRIVMEIAVGNDLYQHHLPDFDDYIVASDYITSRIVSAIKNTEFLQDRVYKLIPCTDLCYVYELDITQLMSTPEHQRCNINITNKMLQNWNVSTDELQEKFYAVAQQMYQQANPQGDPNAQQGAPNDDGVYEADYREVDNDDNNQQ